MHGCWCQSMLWLSKTISHCRLCENSAKGCRMPLTWPLTPWFSFIRAGVKVQSLWDALIICHASSVRLTSVKAKKMVQKYLHVLVWNRCAYLVVFAQAVRRLDEANTRLFYCSRRALCCNWISVLAVKLMYILWMLADVDVLSVGNGKLNPPCSWI